MAECSCRLGMGRPGWSTGGSGEFTSRRARVISRRLQCGGARPTRLQLISPGFFAIVARARFASADGCPGVVGEISGEIDFFRQQSTAAFFHCHKSEVTNLRGNGFHVRCRAAVSGGVIRFGGGPLLRRDRWFRVHAGRTRRRAAHCREPFDKKGECRIDPAATVAPSSRPSHAR